MRGRQQGLRKRLQGTTRPQWRSWAKANNHELISSSTAARAGGWRREAIDAAAWVKNPITARDLGEAPRWRERTGEPAGRSGA